jgi:dTDP-4-dehydrorhamnose 3,5-epimerase
LKFIPQEIADVILIEPTLIEDSRGYFFETFRQDLLNQAIGYNVEFIQENESKSNKGVLRGLHYQLAPFSQAKLVKVLEGSVLDVVVDIRRSSSTFGKHISFELTSENKRQLFVPQGFAHGFVVLSKSATFSYKVDNYYSPENERGIAFDDESLGIDWRLTKNLIQLSYKDKNNPRLDDSQDLLN